MPVNQLGSIRIVDDLHRDPLPFPHSEHRAWSRPVVTDRGDNARPVEFHGNWRDTKGIVNFAPPMERLAKTGRLAETGRFHFELAREP